MNVTNGRYKNRQLHTEDYQQMVSAEQREYAEVFAYQRITENNDIITDFWMDLENIVSYIEGKLFLKVNRAKTAVSHISKIKYLGYAFYRYKGKCKLRVHPKSVKKMKDKLRVLTNKNTGWGNDYRRQKLTEYVRGWINYFSKADMKGLMGELDEWLRRRIRAIYWRQWKKVKTRYRMLRALKLPEWKVHEMANCRKGYWRAAKMLNSVLTNKIIARLGYISMSDYYLKICEN
jgi:hypothetical protein